MKVEWYAPGPKTILPGMAPGGVVVRTYGRLTGRLLSESRLPLGADVEADAERSVREVKARLDPRVDDGVVTVVFDGDSGRRWEAADYASMGLPPPGTRIRP